MPFSSSNQNDTLISALDTVHKPEVHNKLVGQYPRQRDLNWIKEMGKMIEVAQTDFVHHEENELYDAPIIASKSNSGSNVIVVLASASHYNSGANSFPRIGNLVQFKNLATGLIIAKNEDTPSAHTITVAPVNSSQDVQSAAVALDNFIVYSSAFEEGTSGFNKSVIPTLTKITNSLQIFSEFHEVTSSEETNQTWITFTDPNTGETANRYFIKGEADTADRFSMQEDLGLFITPKSDAGLLDASSNTVRTTRALIPHLNANSNLMDYADEVSMSLNDNIIKTLNKNYAVKEYVMGEGINFSIKNKNFDVDFGKNGGIVYNTFGGSADRAVKMGFKSVEMAGFTFHRKTMDILNHAKTTAATGFPYPDYCIMIPMGKAYDSKAAQYVDYFGVRYKKMPGAGSRGDYKVWETGGTSKAGTDSSLKRRINYASEKGLQVFGAKRYILITKK